MLLIEDNADIRENTAELLSLHGYRVLSARNGREGYEKLKKDRAGVILCDILMPQSDGKIFLKLVKEDTTTSSIPLIFFSAGSVPLAVKKGLLKGADDYLSKPFTEEELLLAIGKLLPAGKM